MAVYVLEASKHATSFCEWANIGSSNIITWRAYAHNSKHGPFADYILVRKDDSREAPEEASLGHK